MLQKRRSVNRRNAEKLGITYVLNSPIVWFNRVTISIVVTVSTSVIPLRKDDGFIYRNTTTTKSAPGFANRLIFSDLGRAVAGLDVTGICFELFKFRYD